MKEQLKRFSESQVGTTYLPGVLWKSFLFLHLLAINYHYIVLAAYSLFSTKLHFNLKWNLKEIKDILIMTLTLSLTSFCTVKLHTWAGGDVKGLWASSNTEMLVIRRYAGGITDTLLYEKSNLTNLTLLSSVKAR